MEEKLSRHNVTAMFNRIAPTYDRLNRILSLGIDQRWRKTIQKYLPPAEGLSLVDLATGTAGQILALQKSGIASFIGFDLSEKMLALGLEKIEKATLTHRVKLKIGSALAIPLHPNSVDLITISFGIRNVSDPLRCLKEMRRVLKKGGTAYILEFSTPTFQPFRILHRFYLRSILPAIGKFFSKEGTAYNYLSRSIEDFPSGELFRRLMFEAGFDHVKTIPLTFGIVTLYTGKK